MDQDGLAGAVAQGLGKGMATRRRRINVGGLDEIEINLIKIKLILIRAVDIQICAGGR